MVNIMKELDELLKELNPDLPELTDEQLEKASGGTYINDRNKFQVLVLTLFSNPETEDKAYEIVLQYTNNEKSLRECIKELEDLRAKLM